MAPGLGLRLRPAAALLWVSGGRPLCAVDFRPPGGRFGGVSARGRCVACGLWLPGARFVGVGGRQGAASWGWPGLWVFFALGCGRRAWLGPGCFLGAFGLKLWRAGGGRVGCALGVAAGVTAAPVPTKPVPTNPVAHEGCPLRVFAKGILPVPTRPVPTNFWFKNVKNNT